MKPNRPRVNPLALLPSWENLRQSEEVLENTTLGRVKMWRPVGSPAKGLLLSQAPAAVLGRVGGLLAGHVDQAVPAVRRPACHPVLPGWVLPPSSRFEPQGEKRAFLVGLVRGREERDMPRGLMLVQVKCRKWQPWGPWWWETIQTNKIIFGLLSQACTADYDMAWSSSSDWWYRGTDGILFLSASLTHSLCHTLFTLSLHPVLCSLSLCTLFTLSLCTLFYALALCLHPLSNSLPLARFINLSKLRLLTCDFKGDYEHEFIHYE